MNDEEGRVVYPAASFQPPDSCPECLAGVPFDEQGRHAQAAETPWEDLRASALRDYEDKAAATHSWSSVIPEAINFYFDNFRHPPAPPITQDSASASAPTTTVIDASSCPHLHQDFPGTEVNKCLDCGSPVPSESTVDEVARRAAEKIYELCEAGASVSIPTLTEIERIITTELNAQPVQVVDAYRDALEVISQKRYDTWAFSECVTIAKTALAASPVQVDEVSEALACSCCGVVNCSECGPYTDSSKTTIDDPCRICGKCMSHCPHQ